MLAIILGGCRFVVLVYVEFGGRYSSHTNPTQTSYVGRVAAVMPHISPDVSYATVSLTCVRDLLFVRLLLFPLTQLERCFRMVPCLRTHPAALR